MEKKYTDIDHRAKQCIAQGALTNSKRPECFVNGVYPTHVLRAKGGIVWDINLKPYQDFVMGLGSTVIGHADHEIHRAVSAAFDQGACLSLSSTLEVECAEKVKEIFPCVERLKFLKTGTEACLGSLRIARAYTGKKDILTEGYHGHGDEFISLVPPSLGVPHTGLIRKLENLNQLSRSTAAVIVEPVMTDLSETRIKWARELREKCTQLGIVLIFDEIITGFRFPKFCFSNHTGIQPDLLLLGKAMGSGLPISMIGGPQKIMECGEYFLSSTFAGERLSLAAALKTMELFQTKYSLDELWERGITFLKGFNSFQPDKIRITGYATRGVFEGDEIYLAKFWQEACRAGILFGKSWMFSLPMADRTKMNYILGTCQDIIHKINRGDVRLMGDLPMSPFSQKQRETK